MELFSYTLQPPQHVINSTAGSFTGLAEEGVDEVVANLGTHLALYTDFESPYPIIKPTFCHVFSVATISLPESTQDFLVVTSDSGDITVFDLTNKIFTQLFSIPYARTGMRRYEPGPYLSVSPCGRAIFSSSLEKYKVAFSISKSKNGKPSLSAPIEFVKSHSFIHSCVSLDVGYESPLFAFIERIFKPPKEQREPPFDPTTEKFLCFYELDSNINTIVKKDEFPIPSTSTLLVSVPGPLYNCPGGVIVCSNGSLQYYNKSKELSIIPIPSRRGEGQSVILTSATFCNSSTWFSLLQNQFGDLFYVTSQDDKTLTCEYFDTIPPSTSMLILKQGFLIAFGETNSNTFYSITNLEIEANDSLEFEPNINLIHLSLFQTQLTMSRLTKLITIPSSYGSTLGDIVTIHGSRNLSSLKITRKGIPIHELIRQTIGGNPLSSKTRIFEVLKDGRVQNSKENNFLTDVQTIDVIQMSLLNVYSTIQIHTKGLHVILQDGTIKNWERKSYEGKISSIATNTSQIILIFEDNYITLFEANDRCMPTEISSYKLNNIEGKIISAAIPQPPEGIRVTRWLAIATTQMIIYIVSIDNDATRWEITARQIVDNPISDLAFLSIPIIGHILHIGHENGILSRCILDDNEGEIGSSQIRFLGHSRVTFSKIIINSKRCLLANSSIPWLCNDLRLLQIASSQFISISQIFSSFCPDGGFIGITNNDMCFFEIVDINCSIDTKNYPLQYTPKQIIYIPENNNIFIIYSDMINDQWKSFGQFFDLNNNQFSELLSFEDNLSVTSAIYIPSFGSIAIGFARNLRFNPRRCEGGIVLLIDPMTQEIHHITEVEDIPGALGIFEDYLLSGIGKILRLYKLGHHQLLKRCESRTLPNFINYVSSNGVRIIVGDMTESFIFLKYDKVSDVITPFCDDCVPRFPLSAVLLDRSTVATGDRFGNFSILRLPFDVSDDAEIDPSGVGMIWEHHDMCGCPNKFDLAVNYHVGDPITGLDLSTSEECIVYGTVGGQIGVMIPFITDVEASICRKLEIEVRKRRPTLCGRVHEMFRSYYAPVKCVVDGDMVLEYLNMNQNEQHEISISLQTTPFDISRLLTSIELQM
ncbi:pre-mRNA-splicing factor rse1 [Histomonas meleagridis]|uniref:pre-mRNA-splicing factor rse1 n=1 Tax=Histomonas meleagridis TaxID=135588 RepID=UPI003559F37C|nr:pre-mRNA-splicing factor rse1 [Histomonas meleagridis]KAH0805016.1 pre-mRNA-splicing factor rse1 [Histomonas meleagridis]